MSDHQVYAIDILMVIVYLAASRAAPIWPTRGKDDAEDYFLGGRSYIWPVNRFSLFTMPEFLAKCHDSCGRLAFSAFNVFTNGLIDAAAEPTSPRWSTVGRLGHQVPSARWRQPKRYRRRSRAAQQLIDRWAA